MSYHEYKDKVKKRTIRKPSITQKRLESLLPMRQKKGSIIIWPAYLDSKLSRSEGRRIPMNLGAPSVTAEILKKSADMRGFSSEIEEGKIYPRQGSNRGGYLILENSEGHKKKRMLLMLAKGVRRIVAEREAAKKAVEKRGKGKKYRKGRRK